MPPVDRKVGIRNENQLAPDVFSFSFSSTAPAIVLLVVGLLVPLVSWWLETCRRGTLYKLWLFDGEFDWEFDWEVVRSGRLYIGCGCEVVDEDDDGGDDELEIFVFFNGME